MEIKTFQNIYLKVNSQVTSFLCICNSSLVMAKIWPCIT